jgi:hypothetical protein
MVKLVKGLRAKSRYHQALRESFPNDCIQKLKRAKIRVKVRGEKETVYEYLTQAEMRTTSEVFTERIPRILRDGFAPEPKPNGLKFPKEFKKKKASKREKKRKKKNEQLSRSKKEASQMRNLVVLGGS